MPCPDLAPSPSILRAVLPAALLLPILAAAGCSWSVPADPGENVRLRGHRGVVEDAPAAATGRDHDEGAGAVYAERCGRCHAPFPPSHAPARAWPALVRRYGPRAGLFGPDRDRVTRWLQSQAR